MLVHRHPHSADADVLRAIDSQQVDSRGADVGQADQFGGVVVPAEVVRPVVTLGMEQADWFADPRSCRQGSIGLESVAGRAR